MSKKFTLERIASQAIRLEKLLVAKRKKALKSAKFLASLDRSSSAFLTSYEWRKLRFSALEKYGAKCCLCGATPESGAVMNVDHIKPRKFFPELALSMDNLQVLCHECNHGKGNKTARFRSE